MVVYKTLHDFCVAKGLDNKRIEDCVSEINELWIEGCDDPKYVRWVLQDSQHAGLDVLGVCPWITRLVGIGSRVKHPVVFKDGTAVVLKNKEMMSILQVLGSSYERAFIHALLHNELSNPASMRELKLTIAQIKLLWLLLGLSIGNNEFILSLKGGKFFSIDLLSLLATDAQAKGNETVPARMVEVDGDAEFALISERATAKPAPSNGEKCGG